MFFKTAKDLPGAYEMSLKCTFDDSDMIPVVVHYGNGFREDVPSAKGGICRICGKVRAAEKNTLQAGKDGNLGACSERWAINEIIRNGYCFVELFDSHSIHQRISPARSV